MADRSTFRDQEAAQCAGSRMSSDGRPHKRWKQLGRQMLAAKRIMYQAAGSLGGSGKGVTRVDHRVRKLCSTAAPSSTGERGRKGGSQLGSQSNKFWQEIMRRQRKMGRELKNDCRDRFLTDVAQVKYPASRWKNESELRVRKGRTN